MKVLCLLNHLCTSSLCHFVALCATLPFSAAVMYATATRDFRKMPKINTVRIKLLSQLTYMIVFVMDRLPQSKMIYSLISR